MTTVTPSQPTAAPTPIDWATVDAVRHTFARVREDRLRSVFQALDTNRDGLLSIEEAIQGLLVKGLPLEVANEVAFQTWVATFCSRRAGVLGFSDYVALVRKRNPPVEERENVSGLCIRQAPGGAVSSELNFAQGAPNMDIPLSQQQQDARRIDPASVQAVAGTYAYDGGGVGAVQGQHVTKSNVPMNHESKSPAGIIPPGSPSRRAPIGGADHIHFGTEVTRYRSVAADITRPQEETAPVQQQSVRVAGAPTSLTNRYNLHNVADVRSTTHIAQAYASSFDLRFDPNREQPTQPARRINDTTRSQFSLVHPDNPTVAPHQPNLGGHWSERKVPRASTVAEQDETQRKLDMGGMGQVPGDADDAAVTEAEWALVLTRLSECIYNTANIRKTYRSMLATSSQPGLSRASFANGVRRLGLNLTEPQVERIFVAFAPRDGSQAELLSYSAFVKILAANQANE